MLGLGIFAGLVALVGSLFALRSDGATPRRVGIVLVSLLPLLVWLLLRPEPAPELPPPVESEVDAAVAPTPPPAPPEVQAEPPAVPEPVAELPPEPDILTPEKLDELRNRTALMGSANVIRHYEGERRDWHMVGLKISNVRPTSYWALAGVRSGDIIVEWDGQPVTDPEIAIRVIQELGSKDELRLVVRTADGEERDVYYQIPESARRD